MESRISALFDSPDSADLALMHLRENGVAFKNVSLRTEGENAHGENDRAAYAYVPAFGAPAFGGMGTMNVVPTGFYPAAVSFLSARGEIPPDALSGEAKLAFDVDSSCAEQAKRIIISSHGHRITS